jgi:hypothetical protein
MIISKIEITLLMMVTFLTLNSCSQEGTKNVDNVRTNESSFKAKSLEDRLTDTLFKYFNLTTFIQRSALMNTDYVMYGVQMDSSEVGVIAITDKKLLLYQRFHKEPELIDSFAFTDWARDFKIDDLNGDNRQDFIVYGSWDAHGNNYPYVFLCDSLNVLHYRKDLNIPNISYDRNRYLVKSFWFGGAYDTHLKNLYKWVNDSLEQVAYAELDMEHVNMRPIETRLYRKQNTNMLMYKRVRDEDENVFDTALFEIEY